jgi:hypothetical protein
LFWAQKKEKKRNTRSALPKAHRVDHFTMRVADLDFQTRSLRGGL